MTNYRFEGVVTALSSITHNGGDREGTTTLLRREKFVQADGTVEEIPVISGNGMRGLLRDRGMLHMCRSLGYGVTADAGALPGAGVTVQGLSLPAFYFLFSGGSLTNGGGKAIDIDYARRLKDSIPLVSIFGGAIGNMILPGKLKVGKLIPICRETSHLLPEKFRSDVSVWSLVQEEMYTRKDDARNDRLNPVLDGTTRKMLESAHAAKQAKAADVQEDTGQHQQMMYQAETLAAGTRFYWRLDLEDVSEVEFDAFLTVLVEFSRSPYIGGRSAVGHGEISVRFDEWVSIDSRCADTSKQQAVTLPAGSAYRSHLASQSRSIRELLESVS